MRTVTLRCTLAVATVLAGLGTLAPAAGASTSATLSLDQSAGKAAGSTANLGLDLKFSNTGTDSPHNLTINLPAGLLANASINGGSCLKTRNVSGSSCKVGSGTVTATPDLIGVLNVPLPVSVPVSFYLVPPPAAGDLAGLAVIGLGEQIGSTGEIKIRPTGDPAGVGVMLKLVLPNQLPLTLPGLPTVNLTQISLGEINSTFNGLRYPATCPATLARLSVAVDSYSDSTVHTVTAPLSVTGCSSLPYSPTFKVTAVRDTADRQVRLSTQVTQTAAQAPSRSVSLAFPASTLAPNIQSIQALCLNIASGSCTTVGSVSATSPLYPTALSGKAYLTGSPAGLSLTLVFPAPFPLTLTGAVDLVKNSATFTGLTDIPLTNLGVSLNGGPTGLFRSTCQDPSGTASATLTSQNGDKTLTVPASFSVSGCPGTAGSGASSGGSGGGSNGAVAGNGSSAAGVTVGGTNFSKGRVSGLGAGHPALSFKLAVARNAAKLRAFTIELPNGLSFVRHRAGRRFVVTGIALVGAQMKSRSLSHGHLVIELRKPVSSVTVKIKSSALKESPGLRAKAKTRTFPGVVLTVVAESVTGKRTPIRVRIGPAGL